MALWVSHFFNTGWFFPPSSAQRGFLLMGPHPLVPGSLGRAAHAMFVGNTSELAELVGETDLGSTGMARSLSAASSVWSSPQSFVEELEGQREDQGQCWCSVPWSEHRMDPRNIRAPNTELCLLSRLRGAVKFSLNHHVSNISWEFQDPSFPWFMSLNCWRK